MFGEVQTDGIQELQWSLPTFNIDSSKTCKRLDWELSRAELDCILKPVLLYS